MSTVWTGLVVLFDNSEYEVSIAQVKWNKYRIEMAGSDGLSNNPAKDHIQNGSKSEHRWGAKRLIIDGLC
jgi:hypothetical protein